MTKKILKYISAVLGTILLIILILLGVIFFKPQVVINPKMLNFALTKVNILKTWSWKDAEFDHRWIKWNQRGFSGHFTNLCFVYDKEGNNVDSCVESITWDLTLSWTWEEGTHFLTKEPFKLRSSKTNISFHPAPSEDDSPPDIWMYWSMLWGGIVPDLDIKFEKIIVDLEKKPLEFDLALTKTEDTLDISALEFHLIADPKKFEVWAPKKYLIPGKIKTSVPLYLREVKLEGQVSEKSIDLELKGLVEVIDFQVNTKIDLPIEDEFTSVNFLRGVLLTTTGSLLLKDVKSTLAKYGPKPFTSLPAPLNVMNGDISVKLVTAKSEKNETVIFKTSTNIDLKGDKYYFLMDILADIPFNIEKKETETILLDLAFRKVSLPLPRLSKKELPPQFLPDSRFKKTAPPSKEKVDTKEMVVEEESDLDMKLQALGENALHIRTDLLDEVLRMNFSLNIKNGEIKEGFIQVFPLKTTVFKRKIRIEHLKIHYNYPLTPQIEATILFLLPEYKITLNLEGPVSGPRFAFNSDPPLSKNDIYSVLLFGRPLDGVDNEDKAAARKTNQILSQGILSLSVLYFFAGSTIESLDYDPETSAVSARFRLSTKNSLKVGQENGMNTAGLRRSLGKGWYIESTAGPSTTGASDGNYGVLLERIISY